MTKKDIDMAYEQKIVQEFKHYAATFPERNPSDLAELLANLLWDYEYDIECLTCKGEQ